MQCCESLSVISYGLDASNKHADWLTN